MADDECAGGRMPRRDRDQRADHLVDPARMEQVAVQREGLAMVAEIEAEHGEPGREQLAAQRDDIARLSAALPAVQKDREAPATARLRAEMAEQPHSGAAIDDLVARRGQ